MKAIFHAAAAGSALLLLSACATTASGDQTAANEPKDMPEYATGSIIAKKNKAPAAPNLRTADPAQLDEIRNNAAGGMRAN